MRERRNEFATSVLGELSSPFIIWQEQIIFICLREIMNWKWTASNRCMVTCVSLPMQESALTSLVRYSCRPCFVGWECCVQPQQQREGNRVLCYRCISSNAISHPVGTSTETRQLCVLPSIANLHQLVFKRNAFGESRLECNNTASRICFGVEIWYIRNFNE